MPFLTQNRFLVTVTAKTIDIKKPLDESSGFFRKGLFYDYLPEVTISRPPGRVPVSLFCV